MIGTAKADADGNYSVTLNKAYTNGEALSVTAKDAANNVSVAKTVTAVDTTAPTLTTATLSNLGNAVSGKTESNATVEVKYQDKVIGTAKADADGNYSVTLNKAYTNGEALSVTAKDAANNVSVAKTVYASANLSNTSVELDLIPEFSNQTSYVPKTISERSDYSYLSETMSFTVTGREGLITLNISNPSNILQGSVRYEITGPGLSSSGSQSFNSVGKSSNDIILNERSPLSAGTYTVKITASSQGSALTLKATEKAPVTQEVFTNYDEVTGSIFADGDQKPENYQIKVGDTIIEHKAGQPVTTSEVEVNQGVLTIKSDGTYSYTSAATQLSDDATDKLSIQILDMNGKTLATHQATVTKDATPPEAGVLSLVDFEDTGASDSDRITQDNSFGFVIEANEEGSSVAYEYSFDEGNTWTAIKGASVSNLADGDYQFRGVVSDKSRNISHTNIINVAIDNQAPDLSNAIKTDYDINTSLISISTTTDDDLALYKVTDGVRSEIANLDAIPFEVGSYEAELTDVAGNSAVQAINMALPTTPRYTAKDSVIDIVHSNRSSQEVYGKDQDDILITDGATRLYGEAGNDTLIHTGKQTGYTTLYGGAGDDTYIVDLANKGTYAHILDSQGNNELYLHNILPEEFGFDTNGNHLDLTFNDRTVVSIYEQLGSGGIEHIYFDDGTVWDREYIQTIIG